MAPRPWVTCVGATAAHRACCALSFWRGCPSGLRRLRPTVACGQAGKWRPGWRANSGSLRSCPNAAGRRSRRSTGRCRSRARATRPRPRRKSGRRLKKLEQAVAEERAQHPDKPIEVWATDEHRIGLKPILCRVWAPKGQRPIALGHHRYKWLYVTAFVQPISGEVFWSVSNGVSKPFFAALLARFAREAGAGRDRILVLELDNAGWHTEPNLVVPDGIRLVSPVPLVMTGLVATDAPHSLIGLLAPNLFRALRTRDIDAAVVFRAPAFLTNGRLAAVPNWVIIYDEPALSRLEFMKRNARSERHCAVRVRVTHWQRPLLSAPRKKRPGGRWSRRLSSKQLPGHVGAECSRQVSVSCDNGEGSTSADERKNPPRAGRGSISVRHSHKPRRSW